MTQPVRSLSTLVPADDHLSNDSRQQDQAIGDHEHHIAYQRAVDDKQQ